MQTPEMGEQCAGESPGQGRAEPGYPWTQAGALMLKPSSLPNPPLTERLRRDALLYAMAGRQLSLAFPLL